MKEMKCISIALCMLFITTSQAENKGTLPDRVKEEGKCGKH